MIQRPKDSTDESVAQTLRQERAERAAKTERLRELRLERDAATKAANAPPAGKTATARRPSRKNLLRTEPDCGQGKAIRTASVRAAGEIGGPMRLHQRGVDLLVDLMDAEQHFDQTSPDELRRLIREAVVVFGQLLARDNPHDPGSERMTGPNRRT